MFTSTDSCHPLPQRWFYPHRDKKLSRSNSVWVLLSPRRRKNYCFKPVTQGIVWQKLRIIGLKIMSGRIFDNCQRFQLSDQISDIFHQILPIEISTDDIFKIMPTRMYLFSYLNIVKPVCKQIQLHVSAHRCRILTDVFTCKQLVVICLSPVFFENM